MVSLWQLRAAAPMFLAASASTTPPQALQPASALDGAPSQFVFVKLHEVGSGQAMGAIARLANASAVLRESPVCAAGLCSTAWEGDVAAGGVSKRVAPHCAFPCRSAVLASSGHDALPLAISHTTSLSLPRRWLALGGAVPPGVWATAMLREPTARFLSRFFKYEFEPDAGVHSSGTAGKYRSEGLDRYVSSRNASAMWEVAAIERFLLETDFLNARANTSREADFPSAWREYTEVFGDPASARRLLRGFKIVGISEASTETFYEPLCELLQLPSDACIAASKAETQYSHVNLPHPQMDDFSPKLREYLRKNLAAQVEVYDSAKAIAGERRETDDRYM